MLWMRKMNKWVVCKQGKGYLVKDKIQEKLITNFDKDAVGILLPYLW